ncbi:hypothetical protein [Polluticaenibacter yanchengensis]|uniref:Uncharacterized protein n=1 Tax=Polluticaenibacter yanchengensis TaxID=3014562 RepID=A0ABT4UN29_9BACT|nr:hypothetical protein [Chitinophagaceae bacterium LY-5]
MGFNISGIVINKNLKERKEELSKILDLNLEFDKEIDFETASENWKDEGIIDVYFGKDGTLIFANEDLCLGDGYSYQETNILTFAMSETSMAFKFGYTENGKNIRSKMEVNGETFNEEGDKLEIENDEGDISEVIFKQIETILHQKFWDIQPDEKSMRYFIKSSEQSKPDPAPIISEQEKDEIISEQKVQPEIINHSTTSITVKKSERYILIGLFAFALILLIGVLYVIYSLFTLI